MSLVAGTVNEGPDTALFIAAIPVPSELITVVAAVEMRTSPEP